MIRISTVFTGLEGLPGLSQLYFTGETQAEADECSARVLDFMSALANNVVDDIQMDVQTTAAVIEPGTGFITDFLEVAGGSVLGLSASGTTAGATQAIIGFGTNVVRNGRRVQGRTFIPGVPSNLIAGGRFTSGGQNGFQLSAQGTLGALGGIAQHVVWSRPTLTSPGLTALVNTYTVPAYLGVLRSRRK